MKIRVKKLEIMILNDCHKLKLCSMSQFGALFHATFCLVGIFILLRLFENNLHISSVIQTSIFLNITSPLNMTNVS